MASPDLQKLKLAYDKIAPQHWDEAKQDWDYDKGSDGALHTKQIGEAKVSDASLQAKIDALNAKIDGILDGSTPASTQLKGSNIELNTRVARLEDLINIQKDIYNVVSDDALIYGAYWNKTSDPTMIRTDAAVDKVANVGVDGELVQNDFDKLPIWGEIEEYEDAYGNKFMKIPKFYIRKRSGKGFYLKQVSKMKHPGFYLPALFRDFENDKELDYAYIGKYEASLSDDNKLESKADRQVLVEKNIVEFRNYAQANGKGYQQEDIHSIDVLQTLFHIEFATLHSQSIAKGYTQGNYNSGHTITVAESNTNRAIVSNATASAYEVGQTFGIGQQTYHNQVTGDSRLITKIEAYDTDNTAIYFDGNPVNTSVGDVVANRGWITGFSKNVLASSGTIVADDGKHPFVYRGIENPWGSVYKWVDGININDRQVWICLDASKYASNVFAEPYERLGYVNHTENGYPTEMGFDARYPFAEFPITTGGNSATYYADYYYQSEGQRVARFGGDWRYGSNAGLSLWYLYDSSGSRNASSGGRLIKKAL